MYHYKAKLIRVIDADTIVVLVDLGFYVRTEIHLRLGGVDAPEMDTAGGKKLKDQVEYYFNCLSLNGDYEPDHFPFDIETSKSRSFTRWVAAIKVQGVNINSLINKWIKMWENGETLPVDKEATF